VFSAALNRCRWVTSGDIAEAFVSYLILATAFSQVYWILIHVVDHPCNWGDSAIADEHTSLFQYGHSDRLGYGYIAPVDPCVRMVAALEGMIGIFYIAVIVARLVSPIAALWKAKNGGPTD
jgi:hypothetical protein